MTRRNSSTGATGGDPESEQERAETSGEGSLRQEGDGTQQPETGEAREGEGDER
jgi:hypothetical protein